MSETPGNAGRDDPDKAPAEDHGQPPAAADQRTLRRYEAHLRLLADSLPALVAYVDAGGRYQFNNAAYEEWCGAPPAALRDRPVSDVHGPDAHRRLGPHAATALAGHAVTFDTVLAHPALGQRRVRVNYAPHRDYRGGPVVGFYSLITDLTESTGTRATGLSHAHRAATMGETVTTLAHELSQPLGAITSYTGGAIRMLHTGVSKEEIVPILRSIAEQAQSAASIVRGVREFIDRDSGVPSLVFVNKLLRKSLSLTEARARRINAAVRLDAAAGLRPVRGEAVQIEQVLVNLITNALEAIESASAARREVLVSSAAPEPGQIEIVVRDTGEGLAAERLTRIFDPFYTTKPEGMGMGLAISHSIVEAHGGRLWAESTPGQGTALLLRLPTADEEPPPLP